MKFWGCPRKVRTAYIVSGRDGTESVEFVDRGGGAVESLL